MGLKDQIDGYQHGLHVATPDEAAKKLAALENALSIANRKIGRLFPEKQRQLTDANRDFIRSHAAEFRQVIPVSLPLFGMTFGDSLGYAEEFFHEFNANGISVAGPTQAPCGDDQNGVLVGMRDPSKPSVTASRFMRLLAEMNMHPMPTRWAFAPDAAAFDLFICGEAITSPSPTPPGK